MQVMLIQKIELALMSCFLPYEWYTAVSMYLKEKSNTIRT